MSQSSKGVHSISTPDVNLPTYFTEIKRMTLSSLAGPTSTVLNPYDLQFGESHYTTIAVNANKYSCLVWGDMVHLIGTRNGHQYRFAEYAKLETNTIQILEQDGSGDLHYSAVGSETKGLCVSPTMNVLNVNVCVYTSDTNACSSGWEKDNLGDAVVVFGSHGEVDNTQRGGTHTF